ncbi:hypothetical protein NE398_22390 (plasmid) [Clostridium tertium]|uniref:Uncharacterized protein n=1 Tax=Clostridium tertium TaxID=1559 RepID=A0A9X3XPH2_9CLOT|nr:hypothetical protein [Clostridium tertium]MDC4242863.1 hypothetical protein [Clostridium tertium]
MEIKYIEKINLTIYKVKDSIYGMSSYLDVDFDENLVAIKGTTCKYGSFRKLDKNELKKITELVNKNN